MGNTESRPKCFSSHGGSGYAVGSYWDGEDIICGLCGERITNPPPTGAVFTEDITIFGITVKKGSWEPTWPSWIQGKRGQIREKGAIN